MRTACIFGSFALSVSLLVAPLSSSVAQQPPSPQQPRVSDDALFVYSSGIDALLVDPKDAGLLRALKMLDQRIAELPNEVGDPNMPAPAMQLAMQLLMSPMSLRAGLLDMNQDLMGPPFYAQMSFYGSAEGAGNFAGRFSGMLAEMGAPPADAVVDMPGMQSVDADGVPLYFGTMPSGAGSSFVVGLNKVDNPNVMVNTVLPEGVRPAAAFMLDFRKLQPLMEMMLGQAGPEMDALRPQLEMSGLLGPNAMHITAAVGHGEDRTHSWMRMANYGKTLEAAGLVPESMLSAADLRRIPADATYAQISKVNLGGIIEMIRSLGAQGMPQGMGGMGGDEQADPFQLVEDMTGINPKRDIFDHLGQTMGFYMSDTTGGGGMTSSVMFMDVKNTDDLNATMARVRGMINQLAQEQARGYVRIGETSIAGQKVMTLMFPGLPIPLEVCWTIADGWMYFAASPNALSAALTAGKGTGDGLNGNPRFRQMGGSQLEGAMQVAFIDTPRMLPQGYGAMSMGMSALANAVRSPTDSQRDAGLIMPSFNELMKDAKATVTVTRMSGDDLVVTAQGDRSMLVNAAGAVGAMGGVMGVSMVAGLLGGVTMPAMTQAQRFAGAEVVARGQADEIRAMTQLRMIAQAAVIFAMDNDDRLPSSVTDLVTPGYLDESSLSSPYGPAMDDLGDIWMNPRLGKMSEATNLDKMILAYDRAMFLMHNKVAVAFLDGRVEQVEIELLRRMAQDPAYSGVDFKFPY